MQFFLDFKSDNYGKKKIDEVFGTSEIAFMLKQKEDNMARDISITGGESDFEFTHMRNHEIKQLLYYNRTFGFESIVNLIIETDSGYKITYELDFANSETDDLEYFKCKGIQEGKFQIIKRRLSTKVDVLSETDIDGNYIGGLVPENILLLAKPVLQQSEWKQPSVTTDGFVAKGPGNRTYAQINASQQILTYGIEDSYSFLYTARGTDAQFGDSPFKLITAKNNIANLVINLDNIDISFTTDVDNGGNGYTDYSLNIYKGVDFNTAVKTTLLSTNKTENQTYTFQGSFNDLQIGFLNRGESIWIQHDLYLRQSNSLGTFDPKFEVFFTSNSMDIKMVAESVAYNSVAKSLRLVDVMRQVVKSISGLDINAPRFETLGQFYDNRLLDGNFLRGVNDKAFSVSLEDIENSLTEMRGDWEIGTDGKIFFGIEEDFYASIESGFFDNTQFSSMNRTFNPKYKVNEFRYKYQNYQSLKENEELNSADTIHGESRFAFFNKNVENIKQVNIAWTRDAFLIEATRRKALIIEANTASQDDNTLFCIDSIETAFNNTFTETSTLQHSYNSGTDILSLTNDGTVNFISLGIQVGSLFVIDTVDLNAGSYSVVSVKNNILELSGVGSTSGDGARSTKYTYTLDMNYIPFTNYTGEGFTETENLNAPDNYSNRRYSIARNIYQYWQSYLATCNLYWKNKVIKNTWYKNNGDYTAKYDGIKLTEKADFVPMNPILGSCLYNEVVFANVELEDFITLQENIRSERGYIRSIDNNEQVIKLYSVDMEYLLLEKELIIKGEQKYEPIGMTISTEFDYILVNGETRLLDLEWEIKGQKLYLFDENRFRLYNGIYWNEVSINGVFATSIANLEEMLGLVN